MEKVPSISNKCGGSDMNLHLLFITLPAHVNMCFCHLAVPASYFHLTSTTLFERSTYSFPLPRAHPTSFDKAWSGCCNNKATNTTHIHINPFSIIYCDSESKQSFRLVVEWCRRIGPCRPWTCGPLFEYINRGERTYQKFFQRHRNVGREHSFNTI